MGFVPDTGYEHMKAGLVIYGALDHRSGGYLYDAKIVQYLRKQGDDVQVISLPATRYPLKFMHNLKVAFWRRLAAADFDVLLQDELNHPSLVLGNRWLRRYVSYPIVSIAHHLYADEWAPGWCKTAIGRVEQAYLTSVDAWICNSRSTLRRIRTLGVQRPAVVAYPGGDRLGSGLSRDAIQKKARAPGPLRVLFLGNVIPRKRLDVVLRALARLSEAVWTLDVVGSLEVNPRYVRRMQRLCEQLGVVGNVTFRGRISDLALKAALRERQVLVVPSQHEGFGIVYLEAMAHGMAVIANQKNKLIQHGTNGFLLAGEDDRLVALLHELHRDRSLLECVALNGRDTFEGHPRWDDLGATVRDFLQELT